MVKTVNEAYLDARRLLRLSGIAGNDIEARELVCHALEFDREQFYANREKLVFDKEWEAVSALIDLRLSGVPVQHITGEWEFFSLPLYVTTDTLIPRADTEILVQTAIDFLRLREKGRIMDLCCGCGCIGIAILKNVSDGITCTFCDIHEPALHITRKNIMRHSLTARSITAVADALVPLPENMGKYNVIAANPPYIPSGDLSHLDIEVRHEPKIALDGGRDGLDFYRAIIKNSRRMLNKGGALMLEIGLGQSESVIGMLRGSGFKSVRAQNDMQGIPRVIWGVGD